MIPAGNHLLGPQRPQALQPPFSYCPTRLTTASFSSLLLLLSDFPKTMALRQTLGKLRSPGLRVAAAFQVRGYASPSKIDLDSCVTLQKARSWDEGVESKFSTSSMADIFGGKKVVIFGLPGAFTGVCTRSHIPSFATNAEQFRSKGVDEIICVSVNDPYVMKGWGTSLGCSDKIAFYGDFDGAFTSMMGLECDLSGALMGSRCQRWSALVEDGEIKSLNVEESPAKFEVSGGDHLLEKM